MGVERAETLKEVIAVTEPTPLSGEEMKKFYVPTDLARDPDFPALSQLHEYLYDAPKPLRLLFVSHPGAGKTTELNRLMSLSKKDFWFVFFSVRDELDLATITSVDLLIALMEKLYEQGLQYKLIKDTRVIEPVQKWLSEVVVESNVSKKADLQTNVGVGIDGIVSQIIDFLANIKESFSYSYDSAETVRQVIKPKIAELSNYCNLVIAEITNNLQIIEPERQLFIIVEDTDKLDINVARNLFVNQTALLSNIRASIIYTVPLYLVHSPDRLRLESYFETLTLPMIKTYTIEGDFFTEGREILRKIILYRLSDDLIEVAALDLAIEKTGGILRDLLRVIQNASQFARYAGDKKITQKAVRSSLDRLKSIYSTSVYGRDGISSDDLYAKLKEVAKAPNGRVPVDERLQLLLYTQAVIQYNGRGWYDLHPVMWEVLEEMGMVDETA